MNNRPTVWVIKEQMRSGSSGSSPMDYSAAYEFGDVEFATEFDLPLHRDSSIAKQWYAAVLTFIQRMDPARDSIILTGQPLAIFVVGMIFGSLNICPRILVWKREQNRYVPFDPSASLEATTETTAR